MLFAVMSVAVLALALPMPEAGSTPPNAVPFNQIQQVALSRAGAEYPGSRLGTVIPYVDENGQTVAYMFHFRTDGKTMPDYEQVADEVLAGRQTIGPNTDLTHWTSPYAHVFVSARSDRSPVLSFGYGASEYYAIGRQAEARAREQLGPDAELSRMYLVYPTTYFEFANGAGDHAVYTCRFERTWDSRQAFCIYVTSGLAALAAERPSDRVAVAAYQAVRWQRELAADWGNFTEAFVPEVDRAPFYDWSYGCTPTSGAMVMGYIDRTQNFGRLVDWFAQRHDGVEGEQDYQIPNVQRECAVNMHTDTLTGGTSINNIRNGMAQTAVANGYAWSIFGADGAQWNDYAWDTIMQQVDAGHAMIWSALWEVHSLTGLGYRTDGQFVYVHNTWWTPAEWWAHAPSGPADWSNVTAPEPIGGDVEKVELTYPLGDTFYNSTSRGEVVYVGDTVDITWTNSGHPATSIAIDVSTDGGRNWTEVTASTTDNELYRWYVPSSIPTCDSVRLRLKQYQSSTYTSGDGSFGNFRVLREPLAPRPLAPSNGLPIMNPPVVLVVDSVNSRVDSIEFKVVLGLDTIWHQRDIRPTCPLPDTLFERTRTYKWIVRGHNQYGWGPWGATWSFRIMFSGVEEQKPALIQNVPSVSGLHRIGSGPLSFSLPNAGPGRMAIYDALGNAIALLPVEGGRVSWNLRDGNDRLAGAGLYFARFDGTGPVRKFVLVE